MTATLSVVVPVYFNERSLAPLFEALSLVETELLKRDCMLELIFVDDGSGDNSWEELLKIKRLRSQTRIVKLTRNFGAPHASKAGFSFVTGDCFMVLAADLQDPPDLIPQLVAKWRAGSKFVVCRRERREDPVSSKIFSFIYYKLLRLLVVKDYPKGGFDLALMDKVMLPHLLNSSKNINPQLFEYWLGFKAEVIPYRRQSRQHGKSGWSMRKKIKFFLDSILGFSIVPIRLISLFGLFVSVLSFSYGAWILTNAFLGRAEVRGFATIVALIAFLLGVVIIMLGIIGEYLWRVFDETTRRPESVIDEVY